MLRQGSLLVYSILNCLLQCVDGLEAGIRTVSIFVMHGDMLEIQAVWLREADGREWIRCAYERGLWQGWCGNKQPWRLYSAHPHTTTEFQVSRAAAYQDGVTVHSGL
ncbi:hypothetical protein V8C34DRAFT_278383 [Trichoderma compactum]